MPPAFGPEAANCQLESRMRENRTSGSEGGAAQTNAPSLPLCVQLHVTIAGSDLRGVPNDEGRCGMARRPFPTLMMSALDL